MLSNSGAVTALKSVVVSSSSIAASSVIGPSRLAHLYVFCKGGNSCRLCHDFDLGLAPLIDSHRAHFPESITPIAAPPPLLRFLHQPSHYRIPVHVAQLLDPLSCRPHVEIVEASLPHVLGPK